MDQREENTLHKIRKTFKIYRVGHRSMAKIKREFFQWEECLRKGNTGMLTMLLMGGGTERSTVSTRDLLNSTSKKLNFR